MMALFPNDMNRTHPKHNSLLMHELFFKQNHMRIRFPALCTKKTKPSAEQYQVIDNFIDSMDLESCEAFERLHDPALQRLYQAMENRALNPQDPLIGINDEVRDMLNTPRHMQEQAEPLIEKAKKLFKLEAIEKTTKNDLLERLRKIKSGDVRPMDLACDVTMDITEVGSAAPAQDFAELLSRGEQLCTLIPQIQKVINNITFQSVEVPEGKISSALRVYRSALKAEGPFRYNEWIETFKAQLLERGKIDVWQKIIVAGRYGLITAAESETSTVTDSEAEEFYRITGDTANSSAVADGEDGDIDDLFDDL